MTAIFCKKMMDQLNKMMGTDGAGSYTALRDGFSSVGGTNLQSYIYWSSTEYDSSHAWCYFFDGCHWLRGDKVSDYIYVRACLAF